MSLGTAPAFRASWIVVQSLYLSQRSFEAPSFFAPTNTTEWRWNFFQFDFSSWVNYIRHTKEPQVRGCGQRTRTRRNCLKKTERIRIFFVNTQQIMDWSTCSTGMGSNCLLLKQHGALVIRQAGSHGKGQFAVSHGKKSGQHA